jgi:N-acetylglucosamine-6-phosphate deacetylase
MAKRGAHAPSFLRSAPSGFKSLEETYGADNLVHSEDWLMNDTDHALGVRIITAAPEVDGVLDSVRDLTDRGVVFSIGHRSATNWPACLPLLT